MDSGVRWQRFDAQVGFDWLLRTPEQMPPKIPPLNNPNTQPQRGDNQDLWIAENYLRTARNFFNSTPSDFIPSEHLCCNVNA
jgi:hypothetical protein